MSATDDTSPVPAKIQQQLEETLIKLLDQRGVGKSICPSEVARALRSQGDWRELMPHVLELARKYSREGKIKITQRGQVVDPDHFKGPVRLSLF